MSRMYPTKNDLAESARKDLVEALNACLATSSHMVLQAKVAHWNVKGPHFFPLHELFDKVYAAAVEWTDTIAERAVQLGGVAEGTLTLVGQRSKLTEYDLQLSAGGDHVEAVAQALSVLARQVRASIELAESRGDAATEDLFTEIARGADEMLWFVEAHLHGER